MIVQIQVLFINLRTFYNLVFAGSRQHSILVNTWSILVMYWPYFLLRKAITSWMFSFDTNRYRYGLKGRDTLNLRDVKLCYSVLFGR